MYSRERHDTGEHGRIYKGIERMLWAAAPVPAILLILAYPSVQLARQELEAEAAKEVAAENAEYCGKWGMPIASAAFESCVRDLVGIRARAEERLRELTAAALDF